VPRDAWVLSVGQPDLGQSRPARHPGQIGNSNLGHKAVHENARDIGTREIHFNRAAHERRATAGDRDRNFRELRLGEETLLRLAATIGESRELPCVEIFPLRQMVRKRQIHVVAAKKDVIANRQARELEVAVLFGDRNQGKIRCPTADVHHENDVADFDLLAETVACLFEPGIQRSLRFLEQRHVLETRITCSLHREISRGGIKGRWDGEDDLLSSDVGLAQRVPRTRKVPQIARRGFYWRDLLHL